MALQNTILAENCGATWLDCTVLGMGRGPGNTKTELLSIELSKENSNLSPLIDLIYQNFIDNGCKFICSSNRYTSN